MAQMKKSHLGKCLVIAREGISIPVDSIIFVESNLHKVIFHVQDGKKEIEYTDRCRLADVEEELREYPFCRVHQSYLVNMNRIEKIRRYCIILSNGRQLNVSKKRYAAAREKVLKYKGIV